ncbi:Got1/Sft2-like family-domain-containing protein [Radiomyces spectabilis]|uniref:Got1/Sft2-like family-domain-containing protein n=1 Tax=Radiomyces spectabilis TaxID=64574 RepID=UPI00222051B9|nr:Got1/Sft2-like family-domain-containing protein [Radiomyces spectabilis]KAI8369295.1 Got1/Sft2-like family-domain-containing protein [Radiomyces spectabilis]
MAGNTESSFRDSLRNFKLSRSSAAPISLPTTTANSPENSTFASFRDNASNLFSNVTHTVQGYMPVGFNGEEEEEEPWYQMSRVERVMAFALCLALGIACFCLAIFLFLPMFALAPGKFAATFTLASILVLVSIAMLRGPMAHLKHMMSIERAPFTITYLGTMALTLYFSLGPHNYILTILFAIIQLIALVWYFGSYIPGGVATLRYGTAYIGRRAASVLPI